MSDESDYISITLWIYGDKKIKKMIKFWEQKELCNDWEQIVIELKEHINWKQIHASAHNSCIRDLKQGEVILHVDYSKSYNKKQHNEIQSAYFGQ